MNRGFVLNSEESWFPSWIRDLLIPLEALWGTTFPDFLSGPCGKALVPIIFLWKTTLLLIKRDHGKQRTQSQSAWVYINNFISKPLMKVMGKWKNILSPISWFLAAPMAQILGIAAGDLNWQVWRQCYFVKPALSFESVIWLCNPKTAGGYWISLLLKNEPWGNVVASSHCHYLKKTKSQIPRKFGVCCGYCGYL